METLSLKMANIYPWATLIMGVIYTEGFRQNVLFALGVASMLVTIGQRGYAMWSQYKANKNKNNEENKL